MPQEIFNRGLMLNRNKNTSSKCQVSKISNVQFIDIVHTSEQSVKDDQRIDVNMIEETIDNYGEDSVNMDKDSNLDENEQSEVVDDAMFESLVINDEVADVARVVAEMNGHFTKKIVVSNEQVPHNEDTIQTFEDQTYEHSDPGEKLLVDKNPTKFIDIKARVNVPFNESKIEENDFEENNLKKQNTSETNIPFSSEMISSEIDFVSNNTVTDSYNDFLTNEETYVGRNDITTTVTSAKEMKSTISFQRDHLFSNTNILASNAAPVNEVFPNSKIPEAPVLFYETSGDIPQNESETESGIKGEKVVSKYNTRETSNQKKRKKSLQNRKRSKSKNKKSKKHVINNNINIHNYHNNTHQFICALVINICVCMTLVVAIILPFSASVMVDRKLKHIQCEQHDTIANQSFKANEFLNLYLDKEIIDMKIRNLMDTYLKENDDISKNANWLSKKTVDKKDKKAIDEAEEEWRILQLRQTHKPQDLQLKLRRELYEDLKVLKRHIQATMKQLSRFKP